MLMKIFPVLSLSVSTPAYHLKRHITLIGENSFHFCDVMSQSRGFGSEINTEQLE